ncbi:MAG TPA: hypothetical protein DDW36_02575 [Candidatus Magasanikbacteria bacterium]|nr:hypothetical protein [Candidatus Magasanikbacteria bacterium]
MNNTPRTKTGFSLVDVLVALGILITMAVLLGAFVYTQTLRRSVNYEVVAARVATDALEELKNTSWEMLASSGTISHTSLSVLPNGAGSFSVSVSTSSDALREAEVIIQWRDHGQDKSYIQTTYLSEDGI